MISLMRKVLESLYSGKVTCIQREKCFDPITKTTGYCETTVFENVPCRLSYSKIQSNTDQAPGERPIQEIKLFVAPEVTIPPASKLLVTQNGQTGCFNQSGIPAVYSSHQEVPVKLEKRWA